MKRVILLFFGLCFVLSQAQKPIEIGKKYDFFSTFLNQNREISISVPTSYYNSKFAKANYPVVYVLDAETNFNFVTTAVEKFSSGYYPTLPEMIVVGIKSEDRYQDFTASYNASNPTSGKSDKFTQFLQNEVIPFINKNYRTTNYKIIIGHSLTGVYVLDLMLKQPNSFNSYIAHDPSIWWNELQFLKDVAANTNNLSDARIFISQVDAKNSKGRLQTHYNAIKSAKTILEQNSTINALFKYIQYEGEDHGTVPLKGNLDALRWLFRGYEIEIKEIEKNPNLIQQSFENFSKTQKITFIPTEMYLSHVVAYLKRVKATESLHQVLKYYKKLYPQSEELKEYKTNNNS